MRERVEPSDEGVHYAVPLERLKTSGGAQYIEGGIGDYFHENCPLPSGWRAKPKP